MAQSSPDSASLWTVAHKAPLSMGSPRQEYWSGLPFRSPGDLAELGSKPGSAALQADSLASELPGQRINGSQTPFSQFCLFPNVVFKLFQGI